MNNFFVYTYFGLFNIGSMFRQVLHLTHCIWKGNIHQAYNDPEWKTKFLALNKETQQRIKNKIFKKITSKYGTFLKFYFDFSSLSPYNFYIEIKKLCNFFKKYVVCLWNTYFSRLEECFSTGGRGKLSMGLLSSHFAKFYYKTV